MSETKSSIVAPCYNEEDSIPLFLSRVRAVASSMPDTALEYLFVDDGSSDGSLAVLRALAEENSEVRYIPL